MKKFLRFILVFAAVVSAINITYSVRVSAEISEETLNAVVRIYCEILDDNGNVIGYTTGSGFAVGVEGEKPEYFITNGHVVTNSWEGNIGDVYILLDDDSARFRRESVIYLDSATEDIVGTDNVLVEFKLNPAKVIKCEIEYVSDYGEPDIAIVHSLRKVKDRYPVPLLSVSKVAKGDSVRALGFPANGDEIAARTTTDGYQYVEDDGDKMVYVKTYEGSLLASTDQATMTDGIINRLTVYGDMDCNVIETSTQIGHGNSGGPLLTEDGAVIGITTWSTHDDASQTGSYYAVYIDYAMEILDDYGIDYETYDQKKSGIKNGKLPASAIAAIIIMCVMVLLVIVVFIVTMTGHSDKNKPLKTTGATVRITCLGGVMGGKSFIVGERPVTIGRSSECDIVYPPNTMGISRKHCRLIIMRGKVYLTDLGSSAGTTIVGKGPLMPNQSYEIAVGKKFYIGDSTNVYEIRRS